MNNDNRDLLEQLNQKLLKEACALDVRDENYDTVLSNALKAVDKTIELQKVDDSHSEEMSKLDMDQEKYIRDDQTKKDEMKKDRKVQVGIFAAGLIAAPIIDVVCKKHLGKYIAKIEEFEVFKTSLGKSVSGWFKK